MNPDYFLFGVAFLWVAFASIQDIKTKEIANWLSFSLVFIGLFFKLTYWLNGGEIGYFINGLVSFGFFLAVGYAFYYGSVFAGGDAKLLMGLGTIIPGATISQTLINGTTFIFVLLILGAIWSIIALFTPAVPISWKQFSKSFSKKKKMYRFLIPISLILALVALVFMPVFLAISFLVIISCAIFGYPFLKAVEEGMIISVSPNKLTEGDWILNNIKVGKKMVIKTVHGLSLKDIILLRKAGKNVTIKTGVPFSPAFFFALLAMVFFWVSGLTLWTLLEQLA